MTSAASLTEKIKEHVKDNWLHQFAIGPDRDVASAENFAYRRRILEGLFATLFAGRSVLVLDEASGVYPALVKRAGARSVAASSASEATCALIGEVVEFLDAPADVVNSRMVGFYDAEPYVDKKYSESYEFLLSLGQTWPMYKASGHCFDAIVEACAFVVTDGLVFDWSDAEWASPPPPPEYTREAFCRALAKKFDHVACYSDWLVVATGKLPAAGAPGAQIDWEELIGSDPDRFCNGIYNSKPDWVGGTISHLDAAFLFGRALDAAPSTAVEIGTASGVSTAILANAIALVDRAYGLSDSNVVSYDISRDFYLDPGRRVGDAAREMLDQELLSRVNFRNPATAVDVTDEHRPDSVEFVFIDANHQHPWPALDLLAILPALRPGAEVILHDINLPVRKPESRAWGAKYLFDDLNTPKLLDHRDPLPNIGSLCVPRDKDGLRDQLREIVHAHEWETSVPDEMLTRVLA